MFRYASAADFLQQGGKARSRKCVVNLRQPTLQIKIREGNAV